MVTENKVVMRAVQRGNASLPSSSSSPNSSSSPRSSSWIHLRSALLVAASSPVSSDRGSLKSPWSRRRRKHALLPKQWRSLFKPDGRLSDGGIKFLKKVRSGGVDPSLRAEVWPFLLGVYDMNSSKEERDSIGTEKRKEYENLRRKCQQILQHTDECCKSKGVFGIGDDEGSGNVGEVVDSLVSKDDVNAREPLSSEGRSCLLTENLDSSVQDPSVEDVPLDDAQSSDSDCSDELDNLQFLFSTEEAEEEHDPDEQAEDMSSDPSKAESRLTSHIAEDFSTWQRIIRLDAVRANSEWIIYSPSQATVSDIKAKRFAETVGLTDFDHLEPCMIFHAARLVAILEAYALYDSEIGYCQGMSDLLSPIISVIEDDNDAFWCFVGFMRKARNNFRLDEVGIRRQLNIVSKIIKFKDSHLYRHLEKLQAEDCFFVYRMVVVLFRRELNFEQTLCLWEVMWADQVAIRAGIGKSSSWGKMRLRAPPTDDLLLYAIAACVLQKRKLIIEKYNSMDEIMRECNSMAGQLDVWKLLDDAHELVVTLHGKNIEKPPQD